jgi:hypothetical protein
VRSRWLAARGGCSAHEQKSKDQPTHLLPAQIELATENKIGKRCELQAIETRGKSENQNQRETEDRPDSVMVKITSENGQWRKSVKQRPTQKQDEGKSLGNDFYSANTKPKPYHTKTERSSNKLRAWNEISPVWVPMAEKEKTE